MHTPQPKKVSVGTTSSKEDDEVFGSFNTMVMQTEQEKKKLCKLIRRTQLSTHPSEKMVFHMKMGKPLEPTQQSLGVKASETPDVSISFLHNAQDEIHHKMMLEIMFGASDLKKAPRSHQDKRKYESKYYIPKCTIYQMSTELKIEVLKLYFQGYLP
ncbi:hypothetical protein Tco_0702348 [Tanacetum coccineum]|uniref:Uncharacterized protein n=1 Tax=Tanacetum coccineum TaxID=301880 RepID=A0ABQ4XXJ4_9ASTR